MAQTPRERLEECRRRSYPERAWKREHLGHGAGPLEGRPGWSRKQRQDVEPGKGVIRKAAPPSRAGAGSAWDRPGNEAADVDGQARVRGLHPSRGL